MMTATATRTAAFTITDARYVGAKVGADLRLLNSLYGRPSLESIADFAEEAALLLRDGYLGTVDYGFQDTAVSSWKLRLRPIGDIDYPAGRSGAIRGCVLVPGLVHARARHIRRHNRVR
jgi:hypothetical protein